jgi:hypothetical protein
MLRTNLSTRPFYNERAVQAALGVLAVVAIAFTLFNVVEVLRLSAAQSQLGASAADAEREAQRLRSEAAKFRTQIDPKELQSVSEAAREANAIIDRRAFSWIELLSHFEETLPDDVRVIAVQPRVEKNRIIVRVVAQARRVEDLDGFIEALEQKGAFREVTPIQEATNDEGLIQAVIEGEYAPPPSIAEAAPPAEAPRLPRRGTARE